MKKQKRKLNLSPEERERRRVGMKELIELRRKGNMVKEIVKSEDEGKEPESPKVVEKIHFHCNLANTQIGSIRFSDHSYKTSNPKEIEFLKSFGAKQGCIVKEVKEESKK